jgi:SAM-dependent methyltransferase
VADAAECAFRFDADRPAPMQVVCLLFKIRTQRATAGKRVRAQAGWFGAGIATALCMEAIYERPEDYDLEHEGDDDDVRFYVRLLDRWRPRRVMELASGTGRVTIPLARAAAGSGVEIVGLEREGPMLEEALRKRAELDPRERSGLLFIAADMRDWRTPEPFDLVIAPCSSLCHLLTLEDQLAAWRAASNNLRDGGRFVADLTMPNLAAYADSMQTPPRAFVEIDVDARDPRTGTRLLRYKTTRYLPHEQRAEIRFLYDRFPGDQGVDRYVSDFDSHVYFPREVELLFRLTGFSAETWFGDYGYRRLRSTSRQLIGVGRKDGHRSDVTVS